jgi:hypothetical protein
MRGTISSAVIHAGSTAVNASTLRTSNGLSTAAASATSNLGSE